MTYPADMPIIFNHMVEYRQSSLDRTYAAIADPSRRAILSALMDRPQRVTEIAKPFRMSLNAVSKHIRMLEQAGLVRREVRGREHWLSFNDRPLTEALDWMTRAHSFWSQSLTGLESHLRKKRKRKERRL